MSGTHTDIAQRKHVEQGLKRVATYINLLKDFMPFSTSMLAKVM